MWETMWTGSYILYISSFLAASCQCVVDLITEMLKAPSTDIRGPCCPNCDDMRRATLELGLDHLSPGSSSAAGPVITQRQV